MGNMPVLAVLIHLSVLTTGCCTFLLFLVSLTVNSQYYIRLAKFVHAFQTWSRSFWHLQFSTPARIRICALQDQARLNDVKDFRHWYLHVTSHRSTGVNNPSLAPCPGKLVYLPVWTNPTSSYLTNVECIHKYATYTLPTYNNIMCWEFPSLYSLQSTILVRDIEYPRLLIITWKQKKSGENRLVTKWKWWEIRRKREENEVDSSENSSSQPSATGMKSWVFR